jgi:hypothetical protein
MYHPTGSLEKLGVGGRKILKWIFINLDEAEWTGLIWFRRGSYGGLCESKYKLPVLYSAGKFLTN